MILIQKFSFISAKRYLHENRYELWSSKRVSRNSNCKQINNIMKILRWYTATYILWLIIVYAAVLRLYHLWEPSFWIDEAFSSYATLSWDNLSRYLHNLTQWLSFSLFWVSDWSARLPSVVFSLMSIVVVYLITKKLTDNPLVALIPALLLAISYMDIAWARQARFYSLLQFIFLLQIYLSLLVYYGNRYWYLILAWLCITLYVWVQFHPFLYSWAIIASMILWLKILKNYNKIWHTQHIWLKKIWIPLCSVWCIGLHYLSQTVMGSTSLSSISESRTKDEALISLYTERYIWFLLTELWVIFFIYIWGLLYLALRQEFMKLILFFFTLFIPLTIFSHQGFLYHDRYIYFIFWGVIIWAIVTLFELYKCITLGYLKITFVSIATVLIYLSFHTQLSPKAMYDLGHTSPQVDFKSAYGFLPDDAKVITPFPTLCRWYYGERWNCDYSVAVDIVGSQRSHTQILARWEERYTKLPYLSDLQELQAGESYYIVLDALGSFWWIEQDFRDTLLAQSERIYQDWQGYRLIEIYLYKKMTKK